MKQDIREGVKTLLAADLFDAFEKKIRENPGIYINDYHEVAVNVANSSAWYKGEPVKFLYQPMFFTEKDINRFEWLSSQMTDILNKVIDEYMANPEFRKIFGFPEEMERLILAGSGYSSKFPMARYDIFYPYSEDFRFCEINGDGSSSMNESRVLHQILKKSRALDGIIDKGKLYDYEMFDSWIDVLLDCYYEFTSGDADEKPAIAIVDFEGEGIVSEFEVFKKRMVERGHTAVICDPRELKYTNGNLYFASQKIGLVYRRATTTRIVDNMNRIHDFIKAYLDRSVCVVGGFSSQIIHNKIIFAVLHDEEATTFLNKQERDFIRNHIPYTVLLESENQGLLENIIHNRKNLVLKPLDSYGAHGVHMGKDYDSDEWRGLVGKIKEKPYLVQELCNIPSINMLSFENGSLLFEKYNYITGLFMYNQKFNGFYSRAGRKNIIASIAESYTLPNFVVR